MVPLDLTTLSIIWPRALSIAFVGLMESLTAKLVDDLTHTRPVRSRERRSGHRQYPRRVYGGIAGCAMIGQTIVNVEMGKARSRVSTVVAGLVLLLLVTAPSEVMAKSRWLSSPAMMAIVAVKPLAGTAFVRRSWRATRGRKRW